MAKLGFLGTVFNPLRRVVAPELHGDLPPGTELIAYPGRVHAFPKARPERLLQGIGMLDSGLRAAADGCDAMVIDSLGDYGLDALREALGRPVIGAGEAGFAAAAAGGRSFAIVTVWPASMNFIPEDLMRFHGVAGQCRGITNIGSDDDVARLAGADGYLEQVHRGEGGVLERVITAVRHAADQGAEAVLLGCTCMSPIAARVAAAVDTPVINPLREAAVRSAALAGSMTGDAIRTQRADQVRRMVDAVAGDPPEDCPVCVVGEAVMEPARQS